MRYVVEILRDGRQWAIKTVDAPTRTQAVIVVLHHICLPYERTHDGIDAFAELDDFNAWDEESWDGDPDEVCESHEIGFRVHRAEMNEEEHRMVKMMNEDPRSPFHGMIAMPEE